MRRILFSTTIESFLPLGKALKDVGYNVHIFHADIKSPVDALVLKPVNKILWNLRLLDKKHSIGSQSRFCNKNFRSAKVSQIIKEFKPDWAFFEIGFKPSVEVLEEARSAGITIGAWWTQSARWININQADKNYFDCFFSFVREQVEYAEACGLNAYYLPHGINNYQFGPIDLAPDEKAGYFSDVIFVGSWNRARQAVIDVLNDNMNIKLSLYGPGWLARNLFNPSLVRAIRGRGLFGSQLVKHYIASRIVLNINAWFADKSVGMNQRIFNVPACGAFLLTDYVEGLEEYYRIGEEIETYKNTEELVSKVKYYLKNERARELVARRGYERSRKLPTLREQAEKIAKIMSQSGRRGSHSK
jgi:spore maturation protein CgeB